MTAQETWRDLIEGPRFARLGKFLRNTCWELGLKCEVQEEKGWIRESVRFEVTGDAAKVKWLREKVYEAIEEYNKR